MVSMTTVVGLLVGSFAAVTIGGRSTYVPGPVHISPIASTPAPTAKPRVVEVTGQDFKFDAPDVIPAGLTQFRFLNKGPSIHHMALLKLSGGKTVADLSAALSKPGPLPSWVKEVGGPNAPAPGLEANATLMMEPGNYALICFVDLGGPPHFTKGMVRALRVVPATAPSAAKPKADITATLVDYGFRLSTPIRSGNHTIRVHNAAAQHHEIQLVQLAPGASLGDFMKWMQTMEGPPLGKALGGIAGIEPGMSEYFTADFAPGNYAVICFLPDAKDGKPHFAHGMMQQIEVK